MLFWIFAKWIFTRTFSPQSSWIVMTRPEGEQKLLAFTNWILWKVFQAYCDLFLLCLALSRLARLAELRDEICPKFWQISRRRRRRPQVRSTQKRAGNRAMGMGPQAENHPAHRYAIFLCSWDVKILKARWYSSWATNQEPSGSPVQDDITLLLKKYLFR